MTSDSMIVVIIIFLSYVIFLSYQTGRLVELKRELKDIDELRKSIDELFEKYDE